MQVIPAGIDPLVALSVFGVTGMTAYFGLHRRGPGDRRATRWWYPGRPGPPGRWSGRLARIKGAARVVGIAGTDEKCAGWSTTSGSTPRSTTRPRAWPPACGPQCPDGIDLYFDNVGGEILDICLGQLALRGRVVLCGAISTYNETGNPPGPRNYRQPHRRPGADGGVSHPRLPGPVPRGPAGHGRVGGRGQDQTLRARGRGSDAGPRRRSTSSSPEATPARSSSGSTASSSRPTDGPGHSRHMGHDRQP